MYLRNAVESGIIVNASERGLPENADLPDALADKDNDGRPWDGDRLIYAGVRRGGYGFWGYAKEDGEVLVMAGCRLFTAAEAKDHWSDGSLSARESLAMIFCIETLAALRYREVRQARRGGGQGGGQHAAADARAEDLDR